VLLSHAECLLCLLARYPANPKVVRSCRRLEGRAWYETGKMHNGMKVYRPRYHSCGNEAWNSTQVDFVVGDHTSRQLATALYYEGITKQNSTSMRSLTDKDGKPLEEDTGHFNPEKVLSVNKWAGHGEEAKALKLAQLVRQPPHELLERPTSTGEVCVQDVGSFRRAPRRTVRISDETVELAGPSPSAGAVPKSLLGASNFLRPSVRRRASIGGSSSREDPSPPSPPDSSASPQRRKSAPACNSTSTGDGSGGKRQPAEMSETEGDEDGCSDSGDSRRSVSPPPGTVLTNEEYEALFQRRARHVKKHARKSSAQPSQQQPSMPQPQPLQSALPPQPLPPQPPPQQQSALPTQPQQPQQSALPPQQPQQSALPPQQPQQQQPPLAPISSGAWQKRSGQSQKCKWMCVCKDPQIPRGRGPPGKCDVRCFRGRWMMGDPSVPYDPPYGQQVQLLWGACKADDQGAWPRHHMSWYRYDGRIPWVPI
jgi:hypothetical protein